MEARQDESDVHAGVLGLSASQGTGGVGVRLGHEWVIRPSGGRRPPRASAPSAGPRGDEPRGPASRRSGHRLQLAGMAAQELEVERKRAGADGPLALFSWISCRLGERRARLRVQGETWAAEAVLALSVHRTRSSRLVVAGSRVPPRLRAPASRVVKGPSFAYRSGRRRSPWSRTYFEDLWPCWCC